VVHHHRRHRHHRLRNHSVDGADAKEDGRPKRMGQILMRDKLGIALLIGLPVLGLLALIYTSQPIHPCPDPTDPLELLDNKVMYPDQSEDVTPGMIVNCQRVTEDTPYDYRIQITGCQKDE